MAIEVKEILGYLGIPETDVTDLEKFKEKFSDSEVGFIPIKNHKADIGKVLGTVTSKVKSYASKYAPDMDFKAIADKPIEDIVLATFESQALFNKKLIEDSETKVKDLETKVGQKKDEAVKEWETKYSALENKFKDTDNLLKSTAGEFEGFKKQASDQIKGIKLNVKKDEVFKKLKLISNISNLEKAGFSSLINTKYKFDLDENEEVYVADASNGERIKSTAKAGAFKTPDEVLIEEAIAQGVYALQEKPKFGQPPIQTPPPNQPPVNYINTRTAVPGARN